MKSKRKIQNRALSSARKVITKQIASADKLLKSKNISPEDANTLERSILELKASRTELLADYVKEKISFQQKQIKVLLEDLKKSEIRKEILAPGILIRLNGFTA